MASTACVPHTVPRNVNRTRLHFRDRLRTNLDRASVRDGRLLGQTATPLRENTCWGSRPGQSGARSCIPVVYPWLHECDPAG